MSRSRPLFSISPNPDLMGRHVRHRPWRLILMFAGLLLWSVSGILPSPTDALPHAAIVGRQIGAGVFVLGLVWALARVVAYERRRSQALRSPLAKTVDELLKRRPHV